MSTYRRLSLTLALLSPMALSGCVGYVSYDDGYPYDDDDVSVGFYGPGLIGSGVFVDGGRGDWDDGHRHDIGRLGRPGIGDRPGIGNRPGLGRPGGIGGGRGGLGGRGGGHGRR